MATLHNSSDPDVFSRSLRWAGYLLGFSLGGFFDGILLHQILQWHHLLSALEGGVFENIEVQILADGVFHALMYVIGAVALWLLWKGRRECALPGADRLLLGNAFIGFGVWHMLDGVLSHWILGIHRIRMDAANPLIWDLAWFVVFGVLFVAIGWWLRRGPGAGNGSGRRGVAAAVMLVASVVVAAPVAALPPPGDATVMVFFVPGTEPRRISAGIDAARARIMWASRSGQLWALRLDDAADARLLYQHGAYLVSSSAVLAGCLAWTSRDT